MKLLFECTQCGRCCRGRGPVLVTREELQAIHQQLPLAISELVEETRAGLSLRTVRDGFEERCILLGADGRCRAYEARPSQCRTFPFWPQYLADPAAWNSLAAHCEGIGRGPEVDGSSSNPSGLGSPHNP